MTEPTHQVEQATTRGGLPVSPSMGPVVQRTGLPDNVPLVDRRVLLISVLSVAVAVAAAIIAELLLKLIYLITNISFHHTFSAEHLFSTGLGTPLGNHLGAWVIVVPVIGGIIVGLMARYGSEAIRGHGIPEAMQQVLTRQSRIPPRLTFLKPLSAAIAIGTGGPFGAEGPIIATGGALGSLIGQLIETTAAERKTLLAAGAAAGMAATFGAPVSAALLAIELLLFEFRPRSFIPVALASTTAAGLRFVFGPKYPVFDMPALHNPAEFSLLIYILVGAIVGAASVFVTWAVYAVEDAFDLLPIHWMWWPAIGAVAVGVIGYSAPRTLGVGYENISAAISGSMTLKALAILCVLKFVSWAIALGSGTSGGTLAPLFTIGGALGGLLGAGAAHLLPTLSIDPRVAALVGMAAMFAGASRALLASVVFAFETTLQPLGLLPLLGGCTAAYFVSCALMPYTIMTAKIARHGVRVPAEFIADFLDQVLVGEVAARQVICLRATQTLGDVRRWINSAAPGSSHQGFPILDNQEYLIGVLTRRDLLNPAVPDDRKLGELIKRPATAISADSTLRQAADQMVTYEIGRLPVVDRDAPHKVIGIITRSDLLTAHRRRISDITKSERSIDLRRFRLPGWRSPQERSAVLPAGPPD
jgi:H+/Cl- antiporter ClcA/CBS domain-containing protein